MVIYILLNDEKSDDTETSLPSGEYHRTEYGNAIT